MYSMCLLGYYATVGLWEWGLSCSVAVLWNDPYETSLHDYCLLCLSPEERCCLQRRLKPPTNALETPNALTEVAVIYDDVMLESVTPRWECDGVVLFAGFSPWILNPARLGSTVLAACTSAEMPLEHILTSFRHAQPIGRKWAQAHLC